MRRAVRSLVLAACVAAALAAPAVRSAAEETPRYGGTLVFAIGANPETLNPAITTGVNALAVDCKMFNGLVWLDRDWNPQPELARSWSVTPDGLTYTFKLVENAKWHDGKPFTSADVKFTMGEVLAKFHPRTRLAFANLAGIDTPDAYTVVVRFTKPYAPFLQQMTCQEGAMMPKHLYEGTDVLNNPRNNDNPIGTGPFRFQSYTRGDNLVMARNEQYWKPGQPYLDRVIAKVMSDPASRILALEAGEVDHIQSFFLLKQEVARLRQNRAVRIAEETDLPGNFLLFFNTTRKPLDDKRVRHALAMATNRQQIVDQAVFGLGRPARSAIHTGLKWAHNPEVDYDKRFAYDPARANAALDAAGLKRGPDGKRFGVTLTYNVSQAGFTPMAEIIRNNWQAVGVDVRLEPYENQLVLEKVFTRQDFDVSLQPYTTAGDPAIGITRAYVTTPPPPKPFTNPTGYANPKLDDLFARAVATPSRDVRRRAYFEAQRIIADDLPTLTLVDRIEVDAASAKLRNVFVSAMPYDLWDRVFTIDGKPSR